MEMEKERIIEILGEWNFWGRDLECGIERPHYLGRIEECVSTDKLR